MPRIARLICLAPILAAWLLPTAPESSTPAPLLRHEALGLVAQMTPSGAVVRSESGQSVGLALARWGRGEALRPFDRERPVEDPSGRIVYPGAVASEWWLRHDRGLEQGWTVTRRPEGPGVAPLVLEVGVTGNLMPVPGQRGRSLELRGASSLHYGGLFAVDAAGRVLTAEMVALPDSIRIEVDDEEAVYPILVDPFVQTKKVIATSADPNGQPGDDDRFGNGLALDGVRLVAGAFRVDVPETNAGWGYIFERDQGGGDNWGLVKDFSGNFGAGDNQANDNLGWRVAVSGDIVAISHPGDDAGATNAGAVSVLYKDQGGAGNWGRAAKIVNAAASTDASFGLGLALDDDTLIVGSQGWDESGIGTNSGGIWIFIKDLGGGDNWGQVTGGRIPTPGLTAGDSLGEAVDIKGDIAVAGWPTADNGGKVSIYYRNQGGANNWGHVKTITGDDTAAGDRFGQGVAVDGDTVLVGAPKDASSRGAAYVFQRNEGGNDNWGQTQKLVASDGTNGHEFGGAVDVDSTNLVVGASQAFGTGKVYHFTSSGGTWTQQQRFEASDGASADAFGNEVAISGTTIAVGAPQDDSFRGSAYVFDFDNPPVANDDAYNGVVSGGTLTIAATGVLGNDTDADGDGLTAAKVTDPTNGTLTAFNADGSFTYVANGAFVGTDTFTYKANDGTSDSGNATVTITVASANSQPFIAQDAYTTDEDVTLSVAAPGLLANDTDADGDALTASLLIAPTKGSAAVNADGSLSYTPNANFNGQDQFTYKGTDSKGASANALVTITVNAVDDPPVVMDDAYEVDENGTLGVDPTNGVLANDSDIDGDELTAHRESGPDNGTINFNGDGGFVYTPHPGHVGTDSFQYFVSQNDGAAVWGPGTVTITVKSVCGVSVSPTSASVGSGTSSTSVEVTANKGCDWTTSSNASWLSVSPSSGTGSDTTTVSAEANDSTSEREGTVTIAGKTVTITQAAASCSYDLSSSGTSLDADGGSDSFSVTSPSGCEWDATSDSSWISVSSTASAREAKVDGAGSVSFTVAKNASLQSRSGTVTIGSSSFTVTQDATVCSFAISPTSASVPAAGGSGSVSVTATATTGGDDSVCTWSATSNAGWLSASKGASSVDYTASANAGEARSGTATIAGMTFSLEQAGGSCTYGLSPTSVSVGAPFEDFAMTVSAPEGCAWTLSSPVSWLARQESGTGSGVANLRASANGSSMERFSAVELRDAAGALQATSSITQAAACTGTVLPAEILVGPDAGGALVRVEAQKGCRWELLPRHPFLAAEVTEGRGSQEVAISWQANTRSRRLGVYDLSVEGVVQNNARLRLRQGTGGCDWHFPVIELPGEGRGNQTTAPGIEATVRAYNRGCEVGNLVDLPPWLQMRVYANRNSGRVFVGAWAAPNPNAEPREATVVDPSGNAISVRQGPGSCRLRLLPEQREFTVDQFSNDLPFRVETAPGCAWRLWDIHQSRNMFQIWGTNPNPAGGGEFVLTMRPNASGQERLGVLKLAGETLEIRQLAGGWTGYRFRDREVRRTATGAASVSAVANWRIRGSGPPLVALRLRHRVNIRVGGGPQETTVTRIDLAPGTGSLPLTLTRDSRGGAQHCFTISAVSADTETQPWHLGCVNVPRAGDGS